MSDSPDRQLLNQSAARQLLERAGEIDAETTSVDTLRAAAREAGISEAAFEAALVEMQANVASAPRTTPARPVKGIVIGVAATLLVIAALATAWVTTRLVAPTKTPINETLVKCLPMGTASDVARSTLGSNRTITVSPGSRVLRFEGTPEELHRVTAALDAASRALPSCETTQGR